MTISYYEKLAQLPDHLREIALTNWDETGRPLTGNPLSQAVISVLKLHADDGFKGFQSDMRLLFDDMSDYQIVTYYNVFMAGANYIASRLRGD